MSQELFDEYAGSGKQNYALYARYAAQSLVQLESECEIDVFHAHGPGGQCVNTADSAVRMRHIPTGIVVVSRESRSQFRNRQLCLQKLRHKFELLAMPPKQRTATRPTKASNQRRLNQKKARSAVKSLRGRYFEEED
ncbi:MAG: peptide chain release factor-like protein [Coriobacteriales bacterium]|nr:peptide chain release factor-like protein [Coriobacteriales bacterium]